MTRKVLDKDIIHRMPKGTYKVSAGFACILSDDVVVFVAQAGDVFAITGEEVVYCMADSVVIKDDFQISAGNMYRQAAMARKSAVERLRAIAPLVLLYNLTDYDAALLASCSREWAQRNKKSWRY